MSVTMLTFFLRISSESWIAQGLGKRHEYFAPDAYGLQWRRSLSPFRRGDAGTQ